LTGKKMPAGTRLGTAALGDCSSSNTWLPWSSLSGVGYKLNAIIWLLASIYLFPKAYLSVQFSMQLAMLNVIMDIVINQ
jgi:hypothetical protein